MSKIIKRIEGIKLLLEFVKIFLSSGVQGFRLFFYLKISSLEVREPCYLITRIASDQRK